MVIYVYGYILLIVTLVGLYGYFINICMFLRAYHLFNLKFFLLILL